MLNIAVLVSGSGSNLQAIIDSVEKGEINGKIVTVVSNKPGVYALERAKIHNIPSCVIESKGNLHFTSQLLKHLKENNVDLIVLAGFLCILKEEILNQYKNKIINVHPSLIPSFCGDGFYGLKVHEAALNYGVKVTGATVHFVNEVTDGGKIILQKAVEIKDGDTPQILQKRVMEQAEWIILPKAIKMICDNEIKED
ncbi:MAG: phosphoribosylglycinamide formyltransferase [Clostridia bacterium]|nr:phosphoribosylglycinamide formyltransferase [Clostridia bacterium]